MSTPEKSSQQRTAEEWYSSLDDSGKLAVDRVVKVVEALDPVFEAVNRSIEFSRRARQGISDGAQALVSQTQRLGRDAASWAGQTRTDLGERAADLRDRAGVRAEVAATRVSDSLDTAGRAIAGGAAATRNAAASATQATGRASVAVGQRAAAVAGKVSRWFQEKASNTASRAAAGYHGLMAIPPREGSTAQPPISALAVATVTSRMHASLQGQEQLNAAVGSMDKNQQAMLMAALINSGQAPAAGAVSATPRQATEGRGGPGQPEKGPELGK